MAFSDYTDVGHLSSLTFSKISMAKTLVFKEDTKTSNIYDYSAIDGGYEPFALLNDTYSFSAIKGATYDIISTSYFDPILLKIYDSNGKPIVANSEENDGKGFLLSDGVLYSNDIIFDWVAPYTGTYYLSASWDQGSYYKFHAILINEDRSTAQTQSPITDFYGTSGNDTFYSSKDNEVFYGYEGTDTVVFAGSKSSYSINKTSIGWNINSSIDGSDKINSVERLQFKDKTIALDIDGIAGQAYRIYQAAFDREPDNNGLKYWISMMDNGSDLISVANSFIGSDEFKNMYGFNPSNKDFITKVYGNVLNRSPDEGGYNYWLSQMESGQSKAEVLAGFSESPENKAAVIGVIQNGIELI